RSHGPPYSLGARAGTAGGGGRTGEIAGRDLRGTRRDGHIRTPDPGRPVPRTDRRAGGVPAGPARTSPATLGRTGRGKPPPAGGGGFRVTGDAPMDVKRRVQDRLVW